MPQQKHHLIDIEWPEFGAGDRPPALPVQVYSDRLNAIRSRMEEEGLTHLIVYGDREHFANVQYCTGFDPRFEEALLIIQAEGNNSEKPLLLVGNECEGYLTVSPLFNEGILRAERYQPLSLLSQPRDESRTLPEIFTEEGIGARAKVGCAGWKYFTDLEHPDATHAMEIPAYMVDAARGLAGQDNVVNATDIFMHPDHGLRATCTAEEIAYLEWTSVLASEGIKRLLHRVEDGICDYDLAKAIEYNSEPLNCHPTFVTGDNRERGLSGPIGATVRRGDPLSTNLGYWGSNSCRAGWVAESEEDLPANAKDYISAFAGPYFEVMNEWFRLLDIGTPGAELNRIVTEGLPHDLFGIFLNPGHLIHMDEWLSSPIYPDSQIVLRSGMAIQVDVIPSSPVYFSTRMEDGVALADSDLQENLQTQFPDSYHRCLARREFMTGVLGLEVNPSVLPLSNIPGIVPPYFLQPQRILALS